MLIVLVLTLLFSLQILPPGTATIREYLQCKFCEAVNPEGNISDCSCDFESVNVAAEHFFEPLLREITQSTFFRYFRVDLERECPFWQEDDGHCTMKGCSVCECDEKEVPRMWIDEQSTTTGIQPGYVPTSLVEDILSEPSSKETDKVGFMAPMYPSSTTDSTKISEESSTRQRETSYSDPTVTGSEIESMRTNVLAGDIRLRQQPWLHGDLRKGHTAGSQMSGVHMANARTEDAALDVDYDSFFAVEVVPQYSQTEQIDAHNSKTSLGNTHLCEKNNEVPQSMAQTVDDKTIDCSYDPRLHGWTDMVEDDCPTDAQTGDNPATYGTAEHVSIR